MVVPFSQNPVIALKSSTARGAIVMPPPHAFAPMKFSSRVLLISVLLASVLPPTGAGAEMDDIAYCGLLYELAVKYRGRAIHGETKPDPDMIVALEQCKHGQAQAGIATLERKLREGKIGIPAR